MARHSAKFKAAEKTITAYLDSPDSPLAGLPFFSLVEDTYCALVCDELTDLFLRAFGGDYESSITIRYSDGVGLEAEVYLSCAVARKIGEQGLRTAVERTITKAGGISAGYTPFTKDTALTFTLLADRFVGEDALLASLKRLCRAVLDIAIELA